uniref:Delta-like protein n=1 Tax=Pristionchus pacificus TaxID=54126 RepID=A0A8R1UUJ3_PRIPA
MIKDQLEISLSPGSFDMRSGVLLQRLSIRGILRTVASYPVISIEVFDPLRLPPRRPPPPSPLLNGINEDYEISFAMILLLFLPFLVASPVLSCKEVTTDCNSIDKKIDQVISHINRTIKKSTSFFVKYETDLFDFSMELESQLRADEIMLERLLDMQERHGNQFHETDEFDRFCNDIFNKTGESSDELKSESEQCKSLVNNATRCENCTAPTYNDVNMIFTCTKGYAFDLSQETRQVRCEFTNSSIELVYEGNSTSGQYGGDLTCIPIPLETKKENKCSYTCAETAECSDSKLVCACLKGYVDVSSSYNKSPGSICTKCNNSDPHGTDYVMLYDVSESIKEKQISLMIDFVSDFLKFIDIDNSDNRLTQAKIRSSYLKISDSLCSLAELTIPLSPKSKSQDIVKSLKSEFRHAGGATNTPNALKIANDEVYASLTSDSARPRVTILFTDGAPSSYYTAFENFNRDNHSLTVEDLDRMMLEYSKIGEFETNNASSDRIAKLEEVWHGLIMTDLVKEVKKMRETHKAQLITIYVGRNTEEEKVKLMRAITSEDEELSVDHFEVSDNGVCSKSTLEDSDIWGSAYCDRELGVPSSIRKPRAIGYGCVSQWIKGIPTLPSRLEGPIIMPPNRLFLSLLTILAAVSTVNCGRFSLHFSLPQSSYLHERTLCVNLIGKSRCSIAKAPLQDREISFDFEGPNHPTLHVSILLVKGSTDASYQRLFSVGSTRFLPTNNGSFNVTLRCQKNFFGPACDILCTSDSRKICNNQGQIFCNEGWTGPDCEKEAASTTMSTTVTSTTPLSTTTTVTSSGIHERRASTVDVNMLYGIYIGLILIFISLLCVAFLLIKMNLTIVNAFALMINQTTRRHDESTIHPHSPIFFTEVAMNKVDFDEKDSGRHSFNSREEKPFTQIEIYV